MWKDDLKNEAIIVVLIFGILGGFFNYYTALRNAKDTKNKTIRWRIVSFLGTLSISIGAGYIVFFYFTGKNEDIFITLAYSGFAAYLGIKVFLALEALAYTKLNIRSEDVEKVYKSNKRN